jgi:hypothetical protein
MSVPQKERPASILRAMFAGLGSLLSVKDKVRSKPAAKAPGNAKTTAPEAAAAAETTAAPAPTAPEPVPAEAAEVDPVVTEPAAVEVVEVAAIVPEQAASEPGIVVAEAVEVEAVEVEPVTAETVTPEPVAAEVAAEPVAAAVTAEPASGDALPLANYDELTLASLRARLRNLSVGQLDQLVEYEKSHAARADVITMFERRIAKVQAES